MKTKVKPPCNYFGGKAGPIGDIIADIINNEPHEIYVENFGGMAGAMFKKKPSKIEVYNDLDRRLYNLFLVLRDKQLSKRFIEILKVTPYSRDIYIKSHSILKTAYVPENTGRAGNDEWMVGVALATYIAISQAIQPSLRHNGWRNGGGKFDASVAKMWKKRITNLPAVTERITDWIIENQSAEQVLVRYNQPNALFYCDPPYVHSTRNTRKQLRTVNDYSHEMTDVEHELFLIVAKGVKCKILISGYDNELYNTMLSGWHRKEITVYSGIAAANATPGDDGLRTEVLWANFPFKTQLEIFNV